MNPVTILAGAVFILGGMYISLRPGSVAAKLQRFYSNYPLVRYAGPEQLRTRNGFIVVLGIVLVAIGVLGLFLA